MKTISHLSFSIIVAFFFGITTSHANVLVQWNFNLPLSATNDVTDNSAVTGTNAPCIGTGTFTPVGGVVLQGTGYNIGSPNCPPCDPFYTETTASGNNSSISITNFPAQGAANRTAGFEIAFSTVGFTNISVSWEQRHQQRTCKYFRLQYSTDGANFIDISSAQGGVINIGAQNIFFSQTNNLSAVTTAIENNPNAKLRLVAEFESTAIVGGTNGANYVASVLNTAAEYKRDSEIRVDMFTVWADASGAPPNQFPTITLNTNSVTTIANAPVTNTFTVGDAETPVNNLTVTANSANTNLVVNGNIEFLDTTGAVRRVKITPSPGCAIPSGSANISLTVTDGNAQATGAAFAVVVQSGAPDVQNTADIGTLKNTTVTNSFTLVDLTTPANALTVNYTNSSITNVLANAGISTSGTTSNRTLTMVPQTGALGGTMVSVAVTDGSCSDTNNFLLMVVPQSDVILYDSFNYYPDGPLTTAVGGGVWLNNTDTPGGIQIASHALRLSTTNAEEFARCPLLGRGNYLSTNSVQLYAKVKMTLLTLPTAPTPAANTHIANFSGPGSPGAQRARFFASTSGADPGFYRLGISGGQSTPSAYLATNLSTNVAYNIVTYFNPTNGVARLWVDPASESDPFVEAAEIQTGDIHFYAMRQRTAGVDALIDDLVVATSFNGALLVANPSLQAASVGGNVEISWAVAGSSGFNLQSNADLNTTNWQAVAQAPVEQSGRNVVTLTNALGNNFYRLQK
ncbi:MAG: hypothetical protein ABIR24_04805 [Verrucomicrobiota bacterium]